MTTWAGKIFKVIADACTAKYPQGSASPMNKGLKALWNGTQHQVPGGIQFQFGLKHKIVQTGYKESFNQYHNLAVSPYSTVKELKAVKNRVPRMLHQPMIELSELRSHGVRI